MQVESFELSRKDLKKGLRLSSGQEWIRLYQNRFRRSLEISLRMRRSMSDSRKQFELGP